jgi:hypothetical protein
MSLVQKCESPGFQRTWDNAFEPTNFFLRIVFHMPSSVSNLNSHLPSRAVFLTSRLWIPSPSWSLGEHTTLHLANLYFFFSLCLAKRIWIGNNTSYEGLLLARERMKSCATPY